FKAAGGAVKLRNRKSLFPLRRRLLHFERACEILAAILKPRRGGRAGCRAPLIERKARLKKLIGRKHSRVLFYTWTTLMGAAVSCSRTHVPWILRALWRSGRIRVIVRQNSHHGIGSRLKTELFTGGRSSRNVRGITGYHDELRQTRAVVHR